MVMSSKFEPSDIVRDLGFYFESELSMRQHVSRLTRTCFFQLRRLRTIRHSATSRHWCCPATRVSVCVVTNWLFQWFIRWSPWRGTGATAASSERSCKTYFKPKTIRSHNTGSISSTLVANKTARIIQNLPPYSLQISEQPSSFIPDWTLSSHIKHSITFHSPFCQYHLRLRHSEDKT